MALDREEEDETAEDRKLTVQVVAMVAGRFRSISNSISVRWWLVCFEFSVGAVDLDPSVVEGGRWR